MNVSYIIPAYKVEQYLSQCVESILAQSYTDFEIILVDDGSPDDSPALCDEWARKDSRIRALHKPNGGLSDARNYGLQHAVGDYVVFIDGDDFWRHKNDLEKLVKVAYENPEVDFIGYNCEYYYPDTERYTPWVEYADVLSMAIDKNIATCELVKSGTFPMSACLKFLKRNFLIKNNLFFIKGQIAEDIPWFINVLEKSSKCIFVNHYVYAYRQNVIGSITSNANERSFNSLYNIFKTELDKIENRSFSNEAKDAIKSFLAYEYSILLTNPFNKGTMRKELHNFKHVLKYTMNPKVRLVSKIYNLFGINITELILRLYQIKRSIKK